MNKNDSFSDSSSKSSLKTIRCECGLEILVIPDTKEMGRAIEFHAQEHQKKAPNPKEGEEIFNHIQDLIIRQVLKEAAKQNHKKL
jgi:hypothetical protein